MSNPLLTVDTTTGTLQDLHRYCPDCDKTHDAPLPPLETISGGWQCPLCHKQFTQGIPQIISKKPNSGIKGYD